MSHFDGSGTAPSGPSSGNVGVTGKYGRFEQPGQRRDVADLRVDLLGADDRARDDRRAGAQRRGDEPAAAEPLQLVPVRERLADALEPLRPHADQLAGRSRRSASAVQASVVPCLRLSGPTTGIRNTRSRAEHPQVPVRRVVVVQRDRGHQRVERNGAGVVGDDQRAALVRHVVQAGGLDPEPRPVERPQQRENDVVGEVGVEAELVDVVVAGQPAAQEGERVGERRLPFGRERSGVALGGSPAEPVGGSTPREPVPAPL